MRSDDKPADVTSDSIPVDHIKMDIPIGESGYKQALMVDEIEGLTICHKAYMGPGNYPLAFAEGHATYLLLLKGSGLLVTAHGQHPLEAASILIPPKDAAGASIQLSERETLHYLEFVKVYSAEDRQYLVSQAYTFDQWYHRRYRDCEPYTEKIKSPNTVSRTILPGDIIPRVALGTVEAKGPDHVGAHSHPMLEQLFLGLSDNKITVNADGVSAEMSEFSLIHIPLGSTHSVDVAEHCTMHYVWMDFFLTKEGEEWLDTHNPIDANK